MDTRLDLILRYELSPIEAKAYRLCLLWLDKSKKMFPDYSHARLRKGDPRKSLIWKQCYKAVKETEQILIEEDYRLYVQAQLDILKYISKDIIHPTIDASCLSGEKAWKRWKVWKKKYDLRTNHIEKEKIAAPMAKILASLSITKEFLVKTFGEKYTFNDIDQSISNKNMFRWFNMGKISPYYLLMSPFVKKSISLEELKSNITFDLDVYTDSISEDTLINFKKLFPHEC